MARHPRLFIPGATYHVYCRVVRGEFVFDDNHEAIELVETLCEVRDLDGWTILAWCLWGQPLSPRGEDSGRRPLTIDGAASGSGFPVPQPAAPHSREALVKPVPGTSRRYG